MSHTLISENYFSPLGLVHVIAHRRNTLSPVITAYDAATGTQVIPATVVVNTPFQITITCTIPKSLRVRIT